MKHQDTQTPTTKMKGTDNNKFDEYLQESV